ncbi:MAG: alpha-ketoglutarate-dependent dioxygenase AlkB [Coxiellaceae bacterium]|nr:alpha-ketoglutarate-dependent dioxygenase AlkB [Coxiellaceae bacterium]|tara:strand:+ start:3237 stop:3821 length:585 start_codon:yes stop_codon:yes gene_type:complete
MNDYLVSSQLPDCFLFPHFVSLDMSQQLTTEILSLPLEQETFKMFGKSITVPRESLWMADPGCTYRYSGITRLPQPWSPVVGLLHGRILKKFPGLNSVLINVYRHGDHYMGYHQDNEPEIDASHGILSISLGQSRDFLFKSVEDRKNIIKLSLCNGDGLYMGPVTIKEWLHALPKRKRASGLRINLTFRSIYSK